MKALEPPHSHFVSAAEGWLGLGDVAEARAELDRIQPSLREHPEVLRIRWEICAQEKDWPAALQLGSKLVAVAPEDPTGWLHRAYALRRVPEGGLQAAWDNLVPALKAFPKIAIIPYNLACYACQLQQLDRARELFHRALAAGNKEHIKQLALEDADLKALWNEISLL